LEGKVENQNKNATERKTNKSKTPSFWVYHLGGRRPSGRRNTRKE